MFNEIIFVTVGYQTAKALLLQGATVVMACRSLDKATEARDELLLATDCDPVKLCVLRLDLCDMDSVRSFVSVNTNCQLCLIVPSIFMMFEITLK